ncbi:unnamed protein product (macronuclear) [Paramecium tetraurelia]|uniref:Uncharacterized protein n=1 Tax=Paramecium tetraurelia TaxID=5888 RepID=A0C3I5_PARTE|nr:uncharacterized protein GSPATT00034831001 [Paramecium tetraurelia]CAK65352.1 unnamed protein product [Paramecium tetraurelia]|eukprot:XP_001432749.1 hypothetical protein (macronuclear) [Paramecium tetraurelia strain d4-2]
MLKLNQQILIRSTHANCNSTFQQLIHQDSSQKFQITQNNRKKSSEHIIQKQNLKAQNQFQERKKQNSIPDILYVQNSFIKCHTQTYNEPDNKDYEIQSKKLKTYQNLDISPKRISQDASPLQNILINRKRTCVSENKKGLFKENELQKKPRQKVPNHLQIFNQDFDQPSNRITFQASSYIDDEKLILKSIETPGTAQFMQSNKDDNFVYLNENVYQNTENYADQQIYQRKLSCQEETFMPVQKTVQTKKPYFQSKKGNQDHQSKLECRKIMTILDTQQDRIFESIGLNSSEIRYSPRSDGLNKTLKCDEQTKKNDEFIQYKQIQSKKNVIKDENQPYWKLREVSHSKKKG